MKPALSQRALWSLLVALCLFLFMAPAAMAQDAPAPAEGGQVQGGRSMTMIEFVKYGATVGYIIMLGSVVALGMSIERGIALKRDAVVPPDVISQLEGLLEEEDYEEAMRVCESQPGFLTNVVAAGLPKVGQGWDAISDSMGEVLDFEATKIQQSIGYINYIANVSPLMGLFGTVTGMIGAFNTIATSITPPTPAQLAGGIQQALVTTCMGLMVAIPFGAVYFYFRNKVQKMVLEVAAVSGELMERFKE